MALFCVKPSHRWYSGWLLILVCTVEQAFADDLTIVPSFIPNYFSADYGIDSDHGHSLYLFSNLAVANQHRVSIGYGAHEDTVSGSLEELDTRTYMLGYNYNLQQAIQVGAEYEFWGDNSKITTNRYSFFVSLHLDKVSFSITPQIEDIKVYTSSSNCSGSLDSKAVALEMIFYPDTRWSLNTGYTSYDYSQNYNDLLNCVDIVELPLIISRLQTVADDNEISIGLDYYIESETYGINWLRIESAVDDSSTYVTSAYATTDVFDDWSVTATFGVQENFDNTTTKFIHGTLGYYW